MKRKRENEMERNTERRRRRRRRMRDSKPLLSCYLRPYREGGNPDPEHTLPQKQEIDWLPPLFSRAKKQRKGNGKDKGKRKGHGGETEKGGDGKEALLRFFIAFQRSPGPNIKDLPWHS